MFKTHRNLTAHFLAAPTVLGVIDSYGIELINPIRERRSEYQIGQKGLSTYRWIVDGKLCLLLNQEGLVVAWDCATANVADNTFQPLILFFYNDTATTEIYTLSLHDALPISCASLSSS